MNKTSLTDNCKPTSSIFSQDKRRISTDLRKGQCDPMEVLWFFNNQMLGIGNAPAYVPAPQGYGDGSETGLMTMLTDDMCQLDARVADHQFHINPPLLQVMRILTCIL